METNEAKKIYRIHGLSCAHCAAQFEKNVCNLPGVKEAKVNFGASKITVLGDATMEEIEKAGAFENLKISPEHEIPGENRLSFWKKKANYPVFLSAFFLSDCRLDLEPAIRRKSSRHPLVCGFHPHGRIPVVSSRFEKPHPI